MKRKIQVLKEHCAAIGRDPATIVRSANMPLLFSDKPEESERLIASVNRRYGWPEPYVRDMLLAGSVAQVQEKLGQLQDVGIDQVFIPTFLPPWTQEALDRLIMDVAPASDSWPAFQPATSRPGRGDARRERKSYASGDRGHRYGAAARQSSTPMPPIWRNSSRTSASTSTTRAR